MKIIYEIFIITINALSIPFRLFSKKIDLFHKGRKKAFRILTEYDIKDIKEAVEIYEKTLK